MVVGPRSAYPRRDRRLNGGGSSPQCNENASARMDKGGRMGRGGGLDGWGAPLPPGRLEWRSLNRQLHQPPEMLLLVVDLHVSPPTATNGWKPPPSPKGFSSSTGTPTGGRARLVHQVDADDR